MSWLSTLVHNNALAVSTGLNLVAPGAGTVVTALFGGSPKTTTSALPKAWQGGRPQAPPARESTSVKVRMYPPAYDYTKVQRGPGQTTSMQTAPGTGLCPISGYHPNKASNRVTGEAKGSYCVKNRHINPGNGRAVKRAVRRLRAFHKLAVRVERSLHIGRATGGRSRSRPPTASCRCR